MNAAKAGQNAPAANGISTMNGNRLLHNFDALSGEDNAKVAGILVHPPDQGLCVGHDATIPGNPKVEFELINLVVAEYNVNGVVQKSALLPAGKENLNDFFNEPNLPFFGGELVGDPRCIFDRPKIGVDNNAIYLSVDEYQDWAAGGTIENGADVYIFSKPQLVKMVATNYAAFLDIALGGIPIVSLQPAISTSSTNTEYLANSFPFLADGENNPIAHTPGPWAVTGDSNITSGKFAAVILKGKIINSETYAFPALALSTGSGSPTSSAFLNPDDDRLQTCQYVSGKTWCSLPTAIAIKNDPQARDGVAWFELSQSGGIAAQGYAASAGNYLIYPAIVHSPSGSTGIVFTLTSPTINPSAAFVFAGSGTNFSGIRIAALGATPSTDELPAGSTTPGPRSAPMARTCGWRRNTSRPCLTRIRSRTLVPASSMSPEAR